jgi:hypothetical protein
MRSTWRGVLGLCLLSAVVSAAESAAPAYVFAWPFIDTEALSPRGGTTRGPDVRLAEVPSAAWRELQADELTAEERDRRAILALAGEYRTSFDFLEVLVFEPPFRPARPYRSWATERIFVLADRPGFISLQHLLVMHYIDKDGERQGPVVQKHWRQDWRYEPDAIVEFVGDRVWRPRAVPEDEGRRSWSLTVYHVDDSPRYASVGVWQHSAVGSFWQDRGTWRPLPQRERTVRDDYDVLAGSNRITVQPVGWVHEQDNLKVVFAAPHVPAVDVPFRAREIGVNRYQRIVDYDFAAGDSYWSATSEFWRIVRESWAGRLGSGPLRVDTECEGTTSFMRLFAFAGVLEAGQQRSTADMEAFVRDEHDCITAPTGNVPAAAGMDHSLPLPGALEATP